MENINMKYFIILLTPLFCFSQTIWDGPMMTFTKQNFNNPSLENSQDRITDLVWLTRGGDNVLFNAKTQSSARTTVTIALKIQDGLKEIQTTFLA